MFFSDEFEEVKLHGWWEWKSGESLGMGSGLASKTEGGDGESVESWLMMVGDLCTDGDGQKETNMIVFNWDIIEKS